MDGARTAILKASSSQDNFHLSFSIFQFSILSLDDSVGDSFENVFLKGPQQHHIMSSFPVYFFWTGGFVHSCFPSSGAAIFPQPMCLYP